MGTSVSSAVRAHIRTFAAAAAAFLLALGLAPSAFASEDFVSTGNAQVESVAGPLAGPGYEGDAQSASPNPASEGSQSANAPQGGEGSSATPTLASTLAGSATSIVSADVALDSADPVVGSFTADGLTFVSADVALDSADPVVGSFTADGLTFALSADGVTLVAVSHDAVEASGPDGGRGEVGTSEPSAPSGSLAIPSQVTYNGITYDVTAIGPYSFYLSGATSVKLPDTIASVDDRAFRSSDVARVEVDPANPNLASYDGALYSADLKSLLLIPEGRAGSVSIPSEAEVADASKFSHCSLVDAISVDGDGADFASWDGLLYDASGATLLRVPAGATEITIRDGCTTIAAGALEGCANLERINAPASVASISPDVFTSVPTVSLPAQMAVQDGTTSGVASSLPDQVNDSTDFIPQLTAMVALSSADDDLPEVDPSSIEAYLSEGVDAALWEQSGFVVAHTEPTDKHEASPYANAFTAATSRIGSNVTLDDGYTLCAPDIQGDHASAWSFLDPNGYKLKARVNGYDSVNKWFLVTPEKVLDWDGLTPMSLSYWGLHVNNQLEQPQLDVTKRNLVAFDPSWPTRNYYWSIVQDCEGVELIGFSQDRNASSVSSSLQEFIEESTGTFYAIWRQHAYTVVFDLNGALGTPPSSIDATYDQDATLPAPEARPGYRFLGWNTVADGLGTMYQPGTVRNLTADDGATVTLYAQWSYSLGFDTSSEPGDEDYPGDAMDDKPIESDEGQVPIEDPKRPGYVFEGWVIPNGDGTEAVDQDLVYQGDDGKWYVDASKLPDYAGDDGRVELTARWTSVISVDVPSSVTFYADLVTQGQDSREGATEGVFGQSKVENQSEIDLRVVGLESSAVKTEGSTLGADSILKKADAATPSTSTQKLLSLYPSTKQWTAEELQDPDAVGGTKATTAVDFDLDDILLEKSFKADDFTIAAGGTLNMGYRLNLSETGQQLDYDKLAALEEGQSASIANVSYCFAAPAPLGPTPSGDETDPLYVTVGQAFITANGLDGKAQPGTYGLADIKAAARDLSNHGDDPTQSVYYVLYKVLLDKQLMGGGTPVDLSAPYFQLQVDGVYLPLQLIGICQDTKSDGTGKAGLTFQMRDIYAYDNTRSTAAGGGTFTSYMNSTNTNSGGWGSSAMRATLRSTFWSYLPASVQSAIVGVDKYQQLPSGTTNAYLQKTTGETVWLPSAHEVFGVSFSEYNESEALTSVSGYAPFQYMAYQGNAGSITNTKAVKVYNKSVTHWFLRSARRPYTYNFCIVYTNGDRNASNAPSPQGVAPCFCL